MRITGTCRCAHVTFEAHCPPLITSACHCSGCQKMSASAFSLTALFPAEQFVVAQGSPVIGGLHGPTRHFFCPHCLTWLFSRPAGVDNVVSARSSLLENAHRYRPFMETWTREKLPWVTTGASLSYDAFPDPRDYPALMARFMAAGEWEAAQ